MPAPRKPRESRTLAPPGNGEPPKRPERKPPRTQLGKAIYNLISDLSMVFLATGDTYCATILADNAIELAESWDELAQRNARVKEVLEMIVSGGAYGRVTFATLSVVLPMAQHHGLYPREWPLPMSLGLAPPPASEEVREHERSRPEPPQAGYPGTPPPQPGGPPPSTEPDEPSAD